MNGIRKSFILGIAFCLSLLSSGLDLYGEHHQSQRGITELLGLVNDQVSNNREGAWLAWWQARNSLPGLETRVNQAVILQKDQTFKETCLRVAVACGDEALAEQCLKVLIPDKQLQEQIVELAEYPCSNSKPGTFYEFWCIGATNAINKMNEVVAQFEQKA